MVPLSSAASAGRSRPSANGIGRGDPTTSNAVSSELSSVPPPYAYAQAAAAHPPGDPVSVPNGDRPGLRSRAGEAPTRAPWATTTGPHPAGLQLPASLGRDHGHAPSPSARLDPAGRREHVRRRARPYSSRCGGDPRATTSPPPDLATLMILTHPGPRAYLPLHTTQPTPLPNAHRRSKPWPAGTDKTPTSSERCTDFVEAPRERTALRAAS